MIAFIASRYAGYIGLLAVIAGLFVWQAYQNATIKSLRVDIRVLHADFGDAERINKECSQHVLLLTAEKELVATRVAELNVAHTKDKLAANKRTDELLKRIKEVTTDEDTRPLSPALRAALAGLSAK